LLIWQFFLQFIISPDEQSSFERYFGLLELLPAAFGALHLPGLWRMRFLATYLRATTKQMADYQW